MMCQWCDNPEDLLVECYDNYCLRCCRYSRPVPESNLPPPEYLSQQNRFNPLGYLEIHACVPKYTFIGETSVVVTCINPIRAYKSPEYSFSQEKCLKRFDMSRADYEDGEEKRELAKKVHSYQWLEECRTQWVEVEATRKAKEPARKPMTEEEMENHPNYGKFLKLLEKGKV